MYMRNVSIKEVQSEICALVRNAEEGEEITITRNGQPVAKILPFKDDGLDYSRKPKNWRNLGFMPKTPPSVILKEPKGVWEEYENID